MTSHDTKPHAQPSTPDKHKPAITVTQLVATALAAITAAFLGSFIGIAGTIVGAGIASVISSVASALYQKSLEHTRHRVRSTVSQVRARTSPADRPGGISDGPTDVLRPVAAPPDRHRKVRTGAIVGLAVLTFLVGMGAVTGFELIHGGPISGGDNGTTVSGLFGQPTDRATTPAATTTGTAPTTSAVAPTNEPGPTTTTAPSTTTTTPSTTTAPPTTTNQQTTSGAELPTPAG